MFKGMVNQHVWIWDHTETCRTAHSLSIWHPHEDTAGVSSYQALSIFSVLGHVQGTKQVKAITVQKQIRGIRREQIYSQILILHLTSWVTFGFPAYISSVNWGSLSLSVYFIRIRLLVQCMVDFNIFLFLLLWFIAIFAFEMLTSCQSLRQSSSGLEFCLFTQQTL